MTSTRKNKAEDATEELREAVREAHGVAKDLRLAIREAKDLLAYLIPEAIEKTMDVQVGETVYKVIKDLSEHVEIAQSRISAKMDSQLKVYTDLITKGTKRMPSVIEILDAQDVLNRAMRHANNERN